MSTGCPCRESKTTTVIMMKMLDVMRGLMQAPERNQVSLAFAVVTGCLKIAKESIFTGTNNFVSDTITHSRLNEYFGFVQREVAELFKDADLTETGGEHEEMVPWYHFVGISMSTVRGCRGIICRSSTRNLEGEADQLLEKH